MLRSVLSPEVYLSDAILEIEQRRLFRNMWIFAGLRSSLSSRNAFLTRNIGGVPVVITTADGQTLKAFENLCAHRKMPIQQAAFGNRSLICPYHDWTYTADGCLRGVPNAHLYEMRQSEKEQIRLREFAVASIGNLVFVNLAQDPSPIESQFTPEFLREINEASDHFDRVFAYSTFEVGYNWKLNFENVMDYNHVPFIHSASFGKIMPKREGGAKTEQSDASVVWDQEEAARGPVSLDELSFSAVGDITVPGSWYSPLIRRYNDRDAYYNWFVYPNLNFCSFAGNFFILQQYEPISPSRTRYHLWVVTAERKSIRQDFTALLRGLIEAEKKIIDEDCVFLENMQQNLHSDAGPALHGAYEFRLIRAARWYDQNILQGL